MSEEETQSLINKSISDKDLANTEKIIRDIQKGILESITVISKAYEILVSSGYTDATVMVNTIHPDENFHPNAQNDLAVTLQKLGSYTATLNAVVEAIPDQLREPMAFLSMFNQKAADLMAERDIAPIEKFDEEEIEQALELLSDDIEKMRCEEKAKKRPSVNKE